jgi:hypothetical protein
MKKWFLKLVGLYWMTQPRKGDKLRIVDLPYNNSYPNKNAYIGMEGTVTQVYWTGGFCLEGEHAILNVGRKFRYEKV